MDKTTMQFQLLHFYELSVDQLYQILRLRSEVFVVEQNCVYQDIDNKDQKAMHLLGSVDGELVAYTRLFAPNDYFEKASIGRVIVKETFRKFQYGHLLVAESKRAIQTLYSTHQITIAAQCYLEKFYQQHGFVTSGDSFLEDGIPHVMMHIS